MTSTPRILVLDLETSPHLAYTFSLWNTNIGIHQIMEPTRVISWAAKWHGEKKVMFGAEWEWQTQGTTDSAKWFKRLYDLLMEADAVCHWNGDSFDMPHIRREVKERGWTALPPIRSIDLMKHVKREYRFASNKLDWVSRRLLNDHKTSHTGFQLWVDVLHQIPKAQTLMEKYNKQDVELTDGMLTECWDELKNLPSLALHRGVTGICERCGSADLTRRGFVYTSASKFQRYTCPRGHWTTDRKRLSGADTKAV